MKIQPHVPPVERRALPFAGKVFIIGAALVLSGYGMVTAARHPTSAASNSVAPAVRASVISAGNSAVDVTSVSVAGEQPMGASPDAYGEPRECEAARGISSNCVFE
jgi:hypothetical protein